MVFSQGGNLGVEQLRELGGVGPALPFHQDELAIPCIAQRGEIGAEAHVRVVGRERQTHQSLDAGRACLGGCVRDERCRVLHAGEHRHADTVRQGACLRSGDFGQRRTTNGAISVPQVRDSFL